MATPHDMTVFVRVADKGSFAAAARDLALTPSAISKIITRLEQRLDTQLLTRTTRRLALTAEGEVYLMHCREILAAIEAAEADVAAFGASPRGHIRVNAGTALGRNHLVPLLPDFLSRFPDITVDLGITDRQIDIVGENVDVALRTGTLSDSSLVVRRMATARRVICASPDYLERRGTPRQPADLLTHNCLTITNIARLARWPFHTPEGINRLEVKGDLTTDSADVLLDLALAGHGIVRLVETIAAEPLRQGRLVALFTQEHADEPVQISALMPPGRNRARRVRVFLDFLAECFRRAGLYAGQPPVSRP